MALRRRKKYEEEHESHERWLVSYADFITLLFAFFVVMYAVSSVNQVKYQDLTRSLGTAFKSDRPYGNIIHRNPSATEPVPVHPGIAPTLPLTRLKNERYRKEQENMTAMAMNLANALSPLIHAGKVHVIQTNYGVRIDIDESLLFAPGSAELSGAAAEPLAHIAQILVADPHTVEVQGHTDNIPIHNASFYSNWELSAVRASTVVRLFAENGVEENRLSATGFGSAQPIGDNLTAEGRASNRRVSVMLLYRSPNNTDTDLAEIRPKY